MASISEDYQKQFMFESINKFGVPMPMILITYLVFIKLCMPGQEQMLCIFAYLILEIAGKE